MIRLVLATAIQHTTRQLYFIFLFFNLRNLRNLRPKSTAYNSGVAGQ